MTSDERWEKRNWFLFAIGYFAVGYLSINWLNESRVHYYDVALPFESRIPFVSLFIFGYLAVYASLIMLYFLADEILLWRRTIVSVLLLTTICYIIFLAVPVKMATRPDLMGWQPSGIIDSVAQYYFIIDGPYNLFPSLHVGYPTLATLLVWRTRPVARWILLAMTIFIAVSVILVKQHYIVDVIAGIAVALGCYYATLRTERMWSRWFTKTSEK